MTATLEPDTEAGAGTPAADGRDVARSHTRHHLRTMGSLDFGDLVIDLTPADIDEDLAYGRD